MPSKEGFRVFLILIGMFAPHKNWVTYTLFGIAAIVLIIVLIQAGGEVGWSAGYWWYDNWLMVAGAVFILILVAVIVGSANRDTGQVDSIITKLLKSGR